MDIALSSKDVLKLVDNKANLVTYPELINYGSIDELLYPYDATFILYESKENYGHWCCLFRTNNRLEFFDPYGTYVDDELKYIPSNFRKMSGQELPLLTILMIASSYRLSYNQHQFQKHDKSIQTCGRWCAARLLFRNLPLDIFKKMFYDGSDQLVTELTNEI